MHFHFTILGADQPKFKAMGVLSGFFIYFKFLSPNTEMPLAASQMEPCLEHVLGQSSYMLQDNQVFLMGEFKYFI